MSSKRFLIAAAAAPGASGELDSSVQVLIRLQKLLELLGLLKCWQTFWNWSFLKSESHWVKVLTAHPWRLVITSVWDSEGISSWFVLNCLMEWLILLKPILDMRSTGHRFHVSLVHHINEVIDLEVWRLDHSIIGRSQPRLHSLVHKLIDA